MGLLRKVPSIGAVATLFAATVIASSGWAAAPEPPGPASHGDGDRLARVPVLDNAEAWACLPVEHGEGQAPALPTWARVLARALPATTARMLVLDHVQRTGSSLDPALRAAMRWAAADALESSYGRDTAEADLRRLGFEDDAIRRWTEAPHEGLSGPEHDALAFARALTLEADKVTDAEVARLIEAFGESSFVAMVHLLAYANFQDRLLLALDVQVEPGGPLPPLEVQIDLDAMPEVPERRPPDGPAPTVPTHVGDPTWAATDFDELQDRLEAQRGRASRIRVPSWEEMLAALPESVPQPERRHSVKWTLVGMGYQPTLTSAWLTTMRTFSPESGTDRVFRESIFWVVTRTIHCFY
ncbi:carboxymuconolactone decarboxylase family protein [Tautonia marina]|uniref:carboxymuconolactone decarboxylase family protein n=1 Tax=Tautonia marina TaxID=2653855 RepID=UPI00126117CA|nr:hypothetical protein [Tautonia marina]